MDNNNNGMKIAVIAALVISLVAVGVGFAAFATTLTIEGTATVSTSTWDVKFTSIARVDADSTGDIGSTLPTITANADAGSNTAATKINAFNVTFSEPNQKVVYTATVTNAGSYTAYLTNKSVGTPTCAGTAADATKKANDATNVCSNITYTITGPDTGTSIAAGGTATYTITIQYNDISDASLLPSDSVTVTLPASEFTYSQSAS